MANHSPKKTTILTNPFYAPRQLHAIHSEALF